MAKVEDKAVTENTIKNNAWLFLSYAPSFFFTFINSPALSEGRSKTKGKDIAQRERSESQLSPVHPTVHHREGGKQLSSHKYLNVSLDAVSWGD